VRNPTRLIDKLHLNFEYSLNDSLNSSYTSCKSCPSSFRVSETDIVGRESSVLVEGSIFSVVVSIFTSLITSSTGRGFSSIGVGRVSSEACTARDSEVTIALFVTFISSGSTSCVWVVSDWSGRLNVVSCRTGFSTVGRSKDIDSFVCCEISTGRSKEIS
jgi:hypothetical protein